MSELDRKNVVSKLQNVSVDRRRLLQQAGIAGAGALALSGATKMSVVAGPTINARFQNGEPVQGGVLRLLGHQEVAGLSPEDSGPDVQYAMVANVHSSLMQIDEQLVYQPMLAAEEPAVSDDGLEYTFTLRDNVVFHDGEPFTSEDVKYTYDWIMDEENGSVHLADLESVESVEASDDLTVVFRLQFPNAAFFAQVADKFIYPAHYHAEVGEEEYRNNPIGTGPFTVNEFRPAEFTLLDAFDDFFMGRPNVDQLRLDVVPEPAVRAQALENGDADNSVWTLTPEDDERLEANPDFTTIVTLQSAVNHFPLNNDHPILSDVNVRRAMMHAIDRQAVIDDIFLGNAQLATANLSPATGDFYNPNVREYAYDPEMAEQMLDEAGWVREGNGVRERDGEPLTFDCYVITGDAARRPEAEVVQAYLAEVGIDMQLQEAPVAAILDGMRSGDYDAALFNWTYGAIDDPDASVTLGSTGGNNFSNFRNERVDELLVQGLQELDREARVAIYHEIQEIVAEEVPFLFMMIWEGRIHYSTRVQGLPDPETILTGTYLYPKVYTFWLDPVD